MRLLLLAFSATLLLQAEEPQVEWLKSHAIPLSTPEARHGFDDMQPLKKVVGNARIVSLGEATHGTREFFQLKHRMLEFLATEMGFNVFSIEANMPEAYRLNEYVLTGKGDPAALLKGMYFWTWNTQEVLDMILWMREFNKSGKGRVEFTGFDMQTPDVAMQIVDGFLLARDSAYLSEMRTAGSLVKTTSPNSGAKFGVATGTFPLEAAAGKKIKFSGYIKTENVKRGYAGLWWRVDGQDSKVLAFDNMQGRGATGTTEWKRYEIELPVAADAKNINFGALHTGDGTAWIDGLAVELDGVPFNDTTPFDLDFESERARGFYTGGNGYQVRIDNTTAHSGKQSLQMKFVESVAVDPVGVTEKWEKVLTHMQGSREAYAKAGATTVETEWAIQNARVVLQCLQMRTNKVSRDESMATNIRWILDQSPKTKIVVWAHNGHVATGNYRGYRPMGAALRNLYKDEMVIFGFAFNQGSFQAVDPGKGLRNFTVAPAPAGSLDATFASSGIPIFAIDLRSGPAWFKEPHKTRAIGAVYSEDSASNYLSDLTAQESFDAMLFVEKTTAARKN